MTTLGGLSWRSTGLPKSSKESSMRHSSHIGFSVCSITLKISQVKDLQEIQLRYFNTCVVAEYPSNITLANGSLKPKTKNRRKPGSTIRKEPKNQIYRYHQTQLRILLDRYGIATGIELLLSRNLIQFIHFRRKRKSKFTGKWNMVWRINIWKLSIGKFFGQIISLWKTTEKAGLLLVQTEVKIQSRLTHN